MFFNLLSDREAIMAEMAIQVPFCVHTDIQNALLITKHHDELMKQARKHGVEPKISNEITESKAYDVIILDEFINDELLKKASNGLKDRGIIVARTVDSRIKEDLGLFDKYFRIVMPYHHLNLIFASNFFHPTADIVLQKSDLLDETYYYNSEIHLAEFALPTQIRAYLKDNLKN